MMTDLADKGTDTDDLDSDPDALHLLLEMSEHLAAFRTRNGQGQLVSMRTWTVIHFSTGVEIGVFEHWEPDLRPFNLLALEGYCQWLEEAIDFDSADPDVIAGHISDCGSDVLAVAGYYTDKINDWVTPAACACGAANAHPFVRKCWRCHVGLPPQNGQEPASRSTHSDIQEHA